MSDRQPIKTALKSLLANQRTVYWLGILITVLLVYLQTAAPAGLGSVLQRLEYMIYDQRYAIMAKPERDRSHNIVIVDIDERSLQAEGQWPWDRFKLAELVERLEDHGVLVTGFDITFPEPQRNPVSDLLERVSGQFGVDLPAGIEDMAGQLGADAVFAESIASPLMDVVLALSFNPLEAVEYGALPESIVDISPDRASRLRLQEMAGYTGNIRVLQEAAAGAGIMNQLPDADGVVRRIPLVVRYRDQLYPTLALEMARVYFFEDSFELITHDDGRGESLEGIRIGAAGQYEVPTDGRAQVLVPFVGASYLSGNDHYSYVSATDVLNGEADPALLENALVLIGTTATGLFDLRSTPLDAVYPGVEVHANVLNALLKSFDVQEFGGAAGSSAEASAAGVGQGTHFPYKPNWEPGAMLVFLLVTGLVLSFVLPLFGPALLSVLTLLLLTALVWGNFWAWSNWRMDFSLSLPLLLIVLLAVLNMTWGFLSERRTRQAIKGMFDQYVPPAHIDAMLKDPDKYSFAGESRELTVLFSDIRNFTSISESLSATELKTLLNEFFTPVTGIIFEHQGTIDKYVGDMVMAFWGAPLEDERHREHAVAASLAMLKKVDEMREELRSRGLPDISIGVGLNTGVMNVGDMGSEYRRSYTVLGDAVNLGSRLEGLTKFYGLQCLIGEETYKGMQGFVCRLIDRVQVKGKEQPIEVWEPLCAEQEASEALRERLQRWNRMMACYFARDWDAAREELQALQAQSDEMLYRVYLDRIDLLSSQDLPDTWDGVFRHESK